MPDQNPSNPVQAYWYIKLNCDCPHCGEYVDLLEDPDFWDGRNHVQIGEHATDATLGVEVSCPKCKKEFEVDFVY